MNLFFDFCYPSTIPRHLKKLRPPVSLHWHSQHFTNASTDDEWLSVVGERGWIVLTRDYRFHTQPAVLHALAQYNIGCFYLWGANAPLWESTQHFVQHIDRIVSVAETTPRPFLYRVSHSGRLLRVALEAPPVVKAGLIG